MLQRILPWSLPLNDAAILLLTLTNASNVRSPVQAGSGHGGFAIPSEVKEATRRLTPVREMRYLRCASYFLLEVLSNLRCPTARLLDILVTLILPQLDYVSCTHRIFSKQELNEYINE